MAARLLVLFGGLGTGAFQAGVVSALREGGGCWQAVCGGGAGAVNAPLVADGRFADMARLWADQARAGVPMLASLQDAATAAAAAQTPGAWAVVDPRSVAGLVAMDAVEAVLAPFTAGLSDRLSRRGAVLRVPLLCLAGGEAWLADPARDVPSHLTARLLAAAAATPVACRPVQLAATRDGTREGPERPLVDGSSALVRPLASALEAARGAGLEVAGIDVVLGVPAAVGEAPFEPLGLAEVAARADAARLAAATTADAARLAADGTDVRLVRPDSSGWREFTGRADAEVMLEFPTATTRNGSLLELTREFGAWLAAAHMRD